MPLQNINASMLLLKVTLAHLVTISRRLSHLQVMSLSECYNVNTCISVGDGHLSWVGTWHDGTDVVHMQDCFHLFARW